MSSKLLATARYHAQVNLLGRGLLRYQRRSGERRMRRPESWQHPHLAPPLLVSPRLKELISRHYLQGRYAEGARKVAWVTSGAPQEFLVALGFFIHYPENHAAMCGIKRRVEAISEHAEQEGYSRDICSYARTDIGSAMSGETPVGRLPRPDLLVCATNICQTVLYWYRVLAEHFQVPLVIIDTPFIYARAEGHAQHFVQQQLEAAVEVAERVAGRSLRFAELKAVMGRAKDACELWAQVMQRGQARPAPLTAFDEFIHMAPIVEMRGYDYTIDYYRAMLAELDARIAQGVGAVRNERLRLLWDNLPIWPRLKMLGERLAERRVALVASTYTNAWGELADMVDPERPLESAARFYMHPILNRGTGAKLQTITNMARAFSADGVILHSDRSCKPYSVGQMDQRDRLSREVGLPALLLEADHSDPRDISDEQMATRLDAFIELLEERAA